MKAVVYIKYGLSDVLEFKDVEKPTPNDNEVLIKVHAVSINDWDWGLLQGTPFVNRLPRGIREPQHKILGSDIAGKIEAIGKNVSKFKLGDEVFGDICGSWGGLAEYVCADENSLLLKPDGMTYEEAAAIPQAGLLALQGLQNKIQIQPGQKVLINGAGGGAGTFAIQIAKSYEAEVTGVDRTSKLGIMRSTGADYVIDYTQEDFTKNEQRYDLILDFAAHHSIFDYKRSLSARGHYIMIGGASRLFSQVMLLGPLITLIGSKKMGILMHKPNVGLASMMDLFEAGSVKPVIDRRYSLSEAPEAFKYFGEGQAKGKLVITLTHSND